MRMIGIWSGFCHQFALVNLCQQILKHFCDYLNYGTWLVFYITVWIVQKHITHYLLNDYRCKYFSISIKTHQIVPINTLTFDEWGFWIIFHKIIKYLSMIVGFDQPLSFLKWNLHFQIIETKILFVHSQNIVSKSRIHIPQTISSIKFKLFFFSF